jgi:hypothetical protein
MILTLTDDICNNLFELKYGGVSIDEDVYFQVFWSKRWSVTSHHVTLSVKQYQDMVPGNQTSMIISSLDRDATYHVQV